jgi:hypothetical protein
MDRGCVGDQPQKATFLHLVLGMNLACLTCCGWSSTQPRSFLLFGLKEGEYLEALPKTLHRITKRHSTPDHTRFLKRLSLSATLRAERSKPEPGSRS